MTLKSLGVNTYNLVNGQMEVATDGDGQWAQTSDMTAKVSITY